MGKYLVTVAPNLDGTNSLTPYNNNDLLFDWTPFHIPGKNAAELKSINIIMPGTNVDISSNENELDFELFFAKSINGIAPPSLGTVNSGTSDKAITMACKNNILAWRSISHAAMEDAGRHLLHYNIWSENGQTTTVNIYNRASTILQGEGDGPDAIQGYQTLYIAAFASGAFDFGTGVIKDGAQAATTTTTTLAVTSGGVDADEAFCVGDILIAGTDGAKIGTVVNGTLSNTAVTVDKVEEALANTDEICVRNPIKFHLGFEL